MKRVVQVAGAEPLLRLRAVRHRRDDGPRRERLEGQEQERDRHVEEGVGVGDLARGVRRAGGHEPDEGIEEREHDRHAEELEADVGHGDPPRLRRRAERGGEGRHAGADVGAQDERERAGQGEEPMRGQREHEPDGGRRGRDQGRKGRGRRDAEDRGLGEGEERLREDGAVLERLHPLDHQLQPEEDQAEPEDGVAQVLEEPPLPEEGHPEPDPDEEERVVVDRGTPAAAR